MTGFFQGGVWIDDQPQVQFFPQQYQFSYPDTNSQLWAITEKLGLIERELMGMKEQLNKMEWELRWKK